jgi:integrase
VLPRIYSVYIEKQGIIMTKLTKTFVDNVQFNEKDVTFWDDNLKGFGLRVRKASKAWVIMYRNAEGRLRKLTIGKVDKLTPDEARKLAKERLAEVTQGKDPAQDKIDARNVFTISELCEWYMKEGVSHKKASTLQIDRGRIETHIKPLIGNKSIVSLTRGDVELFMYDIIKGDKIKKNEKSGKKRGLSKVTGGETAASRSVQLLGAIYEFARRRELVDKNPAHGIKKPKSKSNKVYIDIEEIRLLGKALKEAEKRGEPQNAVNAIKLCLLTGCRKDEILSLKWEYIDFKNKCFHFPDTKTGQQTRPFGQGALNLLLSISKQNKNGWVFPSSRGNAHYTGLLRVLKRICDIENPEINEAFITKPITIHGLRHSFASIGATDLKLTELVIAGLLGHSKGSVTNRYSHIPDPYLISVADKLSLHIENAIEGKTEPENNIVELKRG